MFFQDANHKQEFVYDVFSSYHIFAFWYWFFTSSYN